MTEKLNSTPSLPPETAPGIDTHTHVGVDKDLIDRINSIRIETPYFPKKKIDRLPETLGVLPGQKVGDWIYGGRYLVRGDRGNNIFYTQPTEVVRVSKPAGDGMSWIREIPAAEFESWRATQTGGHLGHLMTKSGAMGEAGVAIPNRR